MASVNTLWSRFMSRSRILTGGLLTALVIVPATVAFADVAGQTTREEIRAHVDSVQAAVMRGASAAQVAQLLYAPDVLVVGEKEAVPTRGMQAATKAVEADWAGLGPDGQKRCILSLGSDPGVGSDTVYAAFVTLHCEPNPPTSQEVSDFRTLFVWKKLPQGWRVALEQWGTGKL